MPEAGALAKGSNLNCVGFPCHLSPFSAKVDADLQLCYLLHPLFTLEFCGWVVCTWGTFGCVEGEKESIAPHFLAPLPQLVHQSPAKLLLTLQLYVSNAGLWTKSIVQPLGWLQPAAMSQADGNCEERGCPSLCPRNSCMQVERLFGAVSPLPTSKCDFETYPYKSF